MHHRQPLHKFTAIPDGILFNSLPLTKATLSNLPQESLRYVERANELLTKVKKEDWDDRTPHDGNHPPILARVNMMLALAMPQFLDKRGYNQDEQRVPKGNGRESGRWAGEDGVTAADLKNHRFKGMTPVQIKKQKFVDKHLAAAEKGARELNVPVENLLALSAVESGWGRGDAALYGNNFFGLHHPASFESDFRPARANPSAKIAEFDSYEDSMRSFIEDYGDHVRGVTDPTQFATIVQQRGKFGINMDTGQYDSTYVPKILSTLHHLSGAIAYTRRNPK